MASLFGEKNNGAKAQLVVTGKVARSTVNGIPAFTTKINRIDSSLDCVLHLSFTPNLTSINLCVEAVEEEEEEEAVIAS
jgi:hypothetical protein